MQKLLFTVPILCFLVPSAALAQQSLAQALSNQQTIQAGKIVYQQNCMGCHGVAGDGKSEASKMLSPRPRNLVAGSFKFRTTPSGMMPTLSDLVRTIDQGVPGTSMPSFRLLSQSQKIAVAMYVKSLRSDWQHAEGLVVDLPSPPEGLYTNKELMLASAIKGEKLFQEACATCHGATGKGDGPSAAGLIDGEEQPIRPADLSNRYIKSGKNVKDIFKAITTGLDGSPMPSFADVYTVEQRWDLVSYVMFRRGQGAGIYPANLSLSEVVSPNNDKSVKDSKKGDSQWN